MQVWSWIQSAASLANWWVAWIPYNYLLVGLGGAAGSILRYGTGRAVAMGLPGANSLMATASVNVMGSVVLGGVVAAWGGSGRSHPALLLLGVGVCGGFTTFSTFAMELVDLMHAKQYWVAMGYGLGSVLSGAVGFFAGAWVVQRWIVG
ncbi:MAG: CrcB family protein [Planctomycetes bacterium]|nr:CrcB family protein [Planctomycetota bacterium]